MIFDIANTIQTRISKTKRKTKNNFKSTSMLETMLCPIKISEFIQMIYKNTKNANMPFYIEQQSQDYFQSIQQKQISELQITEKSDIFTPHTMRYIRCIIPSVHQYKKWDLVFSIFKDGVSFNSLYYKCRQYAEFVILIEDMNNNIFGFYTADQLKECKEFYGTGETFIFSFKVFSILSET